MLHDFQVVNVHVAGHQQRRLAFHVARVHDVRAAPKFLPREVVRSNAVHACVVGARKERIWRRPRSQVHGDVGVRFRSRGTGQQGDHARVPLLHGDHEGRHVGVVAQTQVQRQWPDTTLGLER